MLSLNQSTVVFDDQDETITMTVDEFKYWQKLAHDHSRVTLGTNREESFKAYWTPVASYVRMISKSAVPAVQSIEKQIKVGITA